MSYAAPRRSTGQHVVSSDSFSPQGTRKAYWFNAAEVNNYLFISGMGCVISLRGTGVALAASTLESCALTFQQTANALCGLKQSSQLH